MQPSSYYSSDYFCSSISEIAFSTYNNYVERRKGGGERRRERTTSDFIVIYCGRGNFLGRTKSTLPIAEKGKVERWS